MLWSNRGQMIKKVNLTIFNTLDKQIVRWALFSGLVYCALMMEFTGSMFSKLLFSHLLTETIDEVELRRKTGYIW
jgi:hypothetical protein